ncbi:MAG: CARDB domain-containing protein [Gemmataceae bacterium]
MFTTRTLAALTAVAALALTAPTASAQTAAAGRAQANQPKPQARTGQPTPRSANSEKPDLIIADITFDPSDNEVKVKIKNIGDKNADDSHVRLKIVARVGGQANEKVLFDQEKSVGDIGDGNDKTKDFNVNFQSIKTQADAFKSQLLANVDRLALPQATKNRLKKQINDNFQVVAIATADNRNEIAEKNEANNNRTETFPTN